MKPVFQTVIDSKHGNCLSAALASILELDIDEVPNFEVHEGDFAARVDAWLRPRGFAWMRTIEPRLIRGPGLQDVGRLPDTGAEFVRHPMSDNVICMATGKSPRGEYCHSVVGHMVSSFNFEMLHDPHPSGAGLDGLPLCIEFLVPLDPAKLVLK